jgi:ubiquinone biosynthesis protein
MSVGLDGAIQVVDFGIMGRIDKKTRYFLADMLMGFVEHDYARIAKVYVDAAICRPRNRSRISPSLALDRRADPWQAAGRISFARILARSSPRPRPSTWRCSRSCCCLQKNMLIAEGVSRQLNPHSEHLGPGRALIEQWMVENRGPRRA